MNELDELKAMMADLELDSKMDIVMLPVSELQPHPKNPRQDVGDVTELAASIKAGGLHQNLTVVQTAPHSYMVIIGHRRLAACKLAGIDKVPCVIADMDEKTQVATMLAENMQRVDLTVQEQATSMQMMIDLGDTVTDLADRTGLSRKSVKHRLEIAKLDMEKMKEKQVTLSDLEKLEAIESIENRNKVLEYIGTREFEWNVTTMVRKEKNDKAKKALIPELFGYKEMAKSEYYSIRFSGTADIKTYYYSDYDAETQEFRAAYDGNKKVGTLQEIKDRLASGYKLVIDDDCVRCAKKLEKTAEEKEKALQEKKEKEEHDARVRVLNEAWETASKQRYQFIKELKVTPQMKEKAAEMLCEWFLGNEYSFSFAVNGTMFGSIAQVKEAGLFTGWKEKHTLWVLSCKLFGDKPFNDRFGRYDNYYHQKEKFEKMANLIGYIPSTAEQSLIDGTHESYSK